MQYSVKRRLLPKVGDEREIETALYPGSIEVKMHPLSIKLARGGEYGGGNAARYGNLAGSKSAAERSRIAPGSRWKMTVRNCAGTT